MKQLNSDFSKAKVGDPVYHVDGSVREIIALHGYDNEYPIVLNDGRRYMYDGKYLWNDPNPSIFTHPIKIIHADDMPVNPRIAEIESQIQRLKNELETLKEVGK